jgi:carboxymethylenebutenolidase
LGRERQAAVLPVVSAKAIVLPLMGRGALAMSIECRTLSGPDLFGYVAAPKAGARGGVLILPTIFGVNEFARSYADAVANAGLAAAIWDINSGLPLSTDYQECIRRARTLSDEGVMSLTERWHDALKGQCGAGAIGVLGFCIGGRFALLQASRDRSVAACTIAYPSIENPRLQNQTMDALALAAEIECPVQMLRPGNDHVSSSETYEVLTQALLSRRRPTMIQMYPEAEHGFMHRPTPEANVAATKLASPQVIAFLKACLN